MRIAQHWKEAEEVGKAIQCYAKACQESFDARDYETMIKMATEGVRLGKKLDAGDGGGSDDDGDNAAATAAADGVKMYVFAIEKPSL